MNVAPVLEDLLPALKSISHKELAGACPICGGRDRFRFWPGEGETGRWLCRGCDKTGDGIQLLREVKGLSFREACDALKIERKIAPRRRTRTAAQGFVPKASVLPGDLWASMAASVVERAATGPRDALLARGLTHETIQTLRLGYWTADVYYPRETWGLEPQSNPETGRPRKVWVPQGIVIPHFRDGRVVRLKVRRPAGDPKYVMVPGSSTAPVLLAGEIGKPVIVVEGEIDALLLWQEARDIAAALALGTAKAKPDAETMDLLRAAPTILVALDSDDAGAAAWVWWRDTFPQAIRWPVPMGKDPGEAMQAGLNLAAWVKVGLERAGVKQAPSLPARTTEKRIEEKPVLKQDQRPAATDQGEAKAAYGELLRQVRAGTITMIGYSGGWVRPSIAGRADGLAIQDLFQIALPILTARFKQDGLHELRQAMASAQPKYNGLAPRRR